MKAWLDFFALCMDGHAQRLSGVELDPAKMDSPTPVARLERFLFRKWTINPAFPDDEYERQTLHIVFGPSPSIPQRNEDMLKMSAAIESFQDSSVIILLDDPDVGAPGSLLVGAKDMRKLLHQIAESTPGVCDKEFVGAVNFLVEKIYPKIPQQPRDMNALSMAGT